jgi:amino acid adenylation domain-containing protein
MKDMNSESEHPSASGDLATRQARLSEAKRQLLEQRLRGKRRDDADATIAKRTSNEAIPLSSAQERLWFVEQLDPGNVSFNIPALLRLEGLLDVAALQNGLNEVVRRHEILRTTFEPQAGQPVQVIHAPAPVPLPLDDLSSLPAASREAEVMRIAAADATQPFELASGPLFRMRLVRLARERHVLILTVHHIVFDEWSVALFVRELIAYYIAATAGRQPSLPDLPIQYGDFAVWQRAWLKGSERQRLLDYWRQHLADAPRLLEMPTDRPRKAVQTFAGADAFVSFPHPTVDALKTLARTEDATLFMLLLAAWQLLLHRYTDQDQIVVCSGVASRDRRETELLIGCLTNIVVMRGDLTGNPGFRAVLRQARDVALGAFAHQALPFEELVHALHPDRDLSHPPFSQSMIVLLNAPTESLNVQGLRLTPIPLRTTTSQYDLLFHFWEDEQGLTGRLRYSTDLFDAATIERLLGHFKVLIEGILSDPEQRVDDLPMLTASERNQVLVTWNDTRTPFPHDACLHELMEARADEAPDHPAIVAGDEIVTYGELERRANRLAARLRQQGVSPGAAVAIAVRRSIDSVVGLLAILKAGAGYLPLDPSYPRERLEFMLGDVQPPLVLTQSALLPHLPPLGERALCIDSERADGTDVGRLPRLAAPHDLAYMIYTSGSTGNPKAVMVDHRGRVNNFTDFNRRFDIGPNDRVLALSALGFDMSAYDVFGTLAAGATIALPDAADEREPAQWAELMRRHGVTIWHSVPALLRMLVDRVSRDADGMLPALRLALLGGDWIPLSLPERLRSVAPNVRVITMGGATEVSMDSTIYEVDHIDPNWNSIPYGRPMANQTAYVVDRGGQPAPIGVPGELLLGGVGVGWGYCNRSALTAEKFVPDPFGAAGARLYRTGDRARFMPDGNLELLGRLDHQIKIRGVRIEPGEIAARLREHPAVDDAVVIARGDTPGDKRLVAYVLARSNEETLGEALRKFVRDALPEYMVPAACVRLDRLPLTPNGKLDRKALPAPIVNVQSTSSVSAPTSAVEMVIATVWRQVGVMADDINRSFFDLGGHSLLAAQVTARLFDVFQLDVPLRTFFLAPTIGGLSEAIGTLGVSRGVDVGRIAEVFLSVNAMSDTDARNALMQMDGAQPA